MARYTKSIVVLSLLCFFSTFSLPAQAAFPDKPIKLVAHSKPGGGMDILFRQIGNILEKQCPVPLVTENKPGGGSAIAVSAVVTSRTPGYTVLGVTNTHINTPLINQTPHSVADLKPLCFLFTEPLVMFTAADQPWKTAREFFEAARKDTGKRSFGASQVGSTEYLIAYSYIKHGYPFTLVPFEAGGELVTAVMGKHVDVALAEPAEVSSLAKAGKVRILATLTPERLPSMPDVPTITEEGLPKAPITKFRGLMVQKNTSKEAFDYLYTLFTTMQKNSTVWKEYLAANDQTPQVMTPEEFGAYVEQVTSDTEEMLKSIGMVKK